MENIGNIGKYMVNGEYIEYIDNDGCYLVHNGSQLVVMGVSMNRGT